MLEIFVFDQFNSSITMKAFILAFFFVLIDFSSSTFWDIFTRKPWEPEPFKYCQTDLARLPTKNQPLYLKHNTNNLEHPRGKDDWFLSTPQDGHIDLYCEHGFTFNTNKILTLQCKCRCEDGLGYIYEYEYYQNGIKKYERNLASFECKRWTEATVKETGNCIQREGKNDDGDVINYRAKLLDVKFDIQNRGSMPLYQVCFDDRTYDTLYVYHETTPSNDQRGYEEQAFDAGSNFKDVNMNSIYYGWDMTVGRILNNEESGYIDHDDGITRGELLC